MIKDLYYYLLILFSGLFDKEFYLKTYRDVRMADIDPIWHYIKHGWKDNRDPSNEFSTLKYLQVNQDVKFANINPLIHYIIHGKKELRNAYSVKSNKNSSTIKNKNGKVTLLNKIIKFNEDSSIFIFLRENFINFSRVIGIHIKKFEPLFTVAIPIYDRTDQLVESIESIINQSYKTFELLLISDGSPKATLEIINYYENKYSFVRAFRFKNNSGNAVRGRNKAIKEAKGKFLAFQDSDDIADHNRLKYTLQEFSKSNADVVYGGWRAIVDGTRDIGIENNQEFYSPNCDLDMLKKICVPCQSTVSAKTEILKEVGGFNPKMKYREDHELWLRIAYNGYKFSSVNKIITNLRIHENNLELKFKEKDDHWYQLMLKEYKNRIHMKPKIGYVIPGTGISGGIIVICEHANRLIERGYDVSLISQNNQNEIPWYPNLLSNVIPLDKITNNYDVLIATGWQTTKVVHNLSAIKKFYFIQSDESRFYEKGSSNYYAALETYEMDFKFLVIAKWMQKWISEKHDKESIYVPNGLNEKIVHQTDPLKEKTSKLRVLIEGPIDIPFKGVGNAFKAIKGLDCEVWCVSSSGVPKKEWKLDRFFYQVPFHEMKFIYSSCDVLLKMSEVEGFCLPPLEMMKCGGTAVISEVTGIEEYAKNYKNSIIIKSGDIQGARNAINKLINDRNLLRELKENAKITTEKFKWEPTIDKLEEEYYQKLI